MLSALSYTDFSESNHQYDETILVAVTGLSPAVLTETVWALAKENPPIVPNRVVVVTTQIGKDEIDRQLLKSGVWDNLRKEIGRFTKIRVTNLLRFGATGDSIRVISTFSKESELNDIRTDEDNWDAADTLMQVIRQFSEADDIRLIASIAGGRKTMGALLVSVMTVLGRFNDRIVHVLVDEPWESISGFYYPGCDGVFHDATGEKLSSDEVRIQLTEVPFIPLRYLFQQEVRNAKSDYRRLVSQLRGQLSVKDTGIRIRVDMGEGTVCVNQTTLHLTPFEFLFYAYFAKRAKESLPPLSGFDALGAYGEELYKLATLCSVDEMKKVRWRSAVIKRIPDLSADMRTKNNFDPDGSLYRKTANQIRTKMKKSGISSLIAGMLVPRRGRLSIDLHPQSISIHHSLPTGLI